MKKEYVVISKCKLLLAVLSGNRDISGHYPVRVNIGTRVIIEADTPQENSYAKTEKQNRIQIL